MLEQNKIFLNENFPYILECYNMHSDILDVEVVESNDGNVVPQINVNGRKMTLHSKYEPIKEASRIMNKYQDEIKRYDHIFFYGFGFGYHVKRIMQSYPDKKFTIYEPDVNVFYQFLIEKKINDYPIYNLDNLYVEFNNKLGMNFLEQFGMELRSNVLLITLPSYERIFKDKYHAFSTVFRDVLQRTKMSNRAKQVFGKRWTINSLMNLPTTIKTPNLVKDCEQSFKDKPVIIASAGPSLMDEYDTLKYIKDNGLAYIIAVGSANRGLIANNIYPDAVCTYDPQSHNYKVFEPMLEKDITSIPMIYGTSVGYETIQNYKGPKIHVVTSQDSVTPFFWKNFDSKWVVNDAFTVATFAFEIFAKVNVSSIIFVGQNLSFKNNLFYSPEIKRGNINSAELQDKDTKKLIEIQDVNGNLIKTNSVFNQMRLTLEQYIDYYSSIKGIKVINSTKGGAKIKGAPFIPLNELIDSELSKKVVDDKWFSRKNNISYENVFKIANRCKRDIRRLTTSYDELIDLLDKMEKSKESSSLNNFLLKFEKKVKKITKNNYFKIFLYPVTRTRYEILMRDLHSIHQEKDYSKKSNKTIQIFWEYAKNVLRTHNEIHPIIDKVFDEFTPDKKTYYRNDCGVFAYYGMWKKGVVKTEVDSFDPIISFRQTKENNAKIKFKFKGSGFKILAGTRIDFADNIEVSINGENRHFSTKEFNHKTYFSSYYNQTVYDISDLEFKMYDVIITVKENKKFIFNGIKTDKSARLFHIDEVTSINDLEVGKKIRCHYRSSYNKVGTFNGLGKSTNQFIPPESSNYPCGDFYFIMVDKECNKKKLIADRNIQRNISWEKLQENQIVQGENYNLSYDVEGMIRLLSGGAYYGDENNEWDKYIAKQQKFYKVNSLSDYWNTGSGIETRRIASWTSSKIDGDPSKVMRRTLTGDHQYNDNKQSLTMVKSVSSGFRPLCLINHVR
ncbi:motility associated factor glycosyltransferase family protein [Gracilibacillus lacisalsi]|uniref:motility associated factor glycosyltransferase family protein n=1 Tax=Gracilibacillus lacisalsi TaxID=393087 RepID=UPI00036A8C7B|nr:6-hydroxymethylpterin diphosphokinase MptE-like protein [Gracilibacillus lacisalsi]